MKRGLLALLVLLAGCGGDDEKPPLTVFAASSLKGAMTEYAEQFPGAEVRLSFAGSDKLAAQLRQGVPADVFASADTRTPEALNAEGLLETPVVFAANRLVLAVPKGSRIRSLDDAAGPGVNLGIGAESVPVGRYARSLLSPGLRANVRTEEPDVASITAKVREGAVDAGFVYYTEVVASKGALEAVELDGAETPRLAAAVLSDARDREAAQAFVDGLVSGKGRQALMRAGFGEP